MAGYEDGSWTSHPRGRDGGGYPVGPPPINPFHPPLYWVSAPIPAPAPAPVFAPGPGPVRADLGYQGIFPLNPYYASAAFSNAHYGVMPLPPPLTPPPTLPLPLLPPLPPPPPHNPTYPVPVLGPVNPNPPRNLCGHSTMTRKPSITDADRCDICHRRPYLGWLYLCTEDATDFYAERAVVEDRFLSPWITKAVDEGHYTDEQIQKMVSQKLDVREIAEELLQPKPSPVDLEESSTALVKVKNWYDDDDEGYEDDEVLREDNIGDIRAAAKRQYDLGCSSSSSNLRTEPEPEPEPQPIPLPAPSARPCHFKCCHGCRPIFQERTWASIDAICHDELDGPTAKQLLTPVEQENRRVSDVNVVRNLGARRPIPPPPVFFTMDEFDNIYRVETESVYRPPTRDTSGSSSRNSTPRRNRPPLFPPRRRF